MTHDELAEMLRVHVMRLANANTGLSPTAWHIISNDILEAAARLSAFEARAEAAEADQWRTIESAPSEGKVWVFGGRRYDAPELVLADGEYWRYVRDNQLLKSGPTHWHPFYIPPPPEPTQ